MCPSSKNQLLAENASFGKVKSFLDTFEIMNAGSKTCFVSIETDFQRAFVCPAMCVHAFQKSPGVIRVDSEFAKFRIRQAQNSLTLPEFNDTDFLSPV